MQAGEHWHPSVIRPVVDYIRLQVFFQCYKFIEK
nr:MAG TPA: hypothetical protein [Caudoviricetes sp.]